ncbi:DUF3893 domain-containing protein [Streptomyces ipomoeae]|uniref:DUF3893 domain-containing protein n=1 Tax=Streptomyces ipomoeae TaxID=103232 RepID=A0AAE8VTG6_9ACTN|nr:DUF3962 domain-containing protein [Streptomyces ipomoeae]TQE15525.1 DUF3893 domain-containing protein [Streptomyces ipomoeae]
MNNAEKNAGKKKPPPPRYEHILTPAFVAAKGAKLEVEVHSAPFPRELLARLHRAWKSNPVARSDYLPTYALKELVQCVEPAVIGVNSELDQGSWLRALHLPDDERAVQFALEAWITTQVAPHQDDVDWPGLIKAALPLEWSTSEVNLLAHGTRPNGTANNPPFAYDLLPSYLATRWLEEKLALPGQRTGETSVLGPLGGRERSIFQWPPRELEDEDAYGLWTHQTAFRVVTMPHDERLVLRVTPHISRFGGRPPAYIPKRGYDKPAGATVLLHIPGGVLRSIERPLLLRAPVTVTGRMEQMTWKWQPGIARILPSLPSRHLYPDPDAVRTDPARYSGLRRADQESNDPVALLWHATGYTYLDPAYRSSEDNGDGARRRTHSHPADTGLQPIDHLQLFEGLNGPLREWGFEPIERIDKIPQRRAPRLQPVDPGAVYYLELWHSAPATYDAVHLALTRMLGYAHTAPIDGSDQPHIYHGPCEIRLQLRNPGTLTSGLPKPADGTTSEKAAHRRRLREERTVALREEFPATEHLAGCLVEIDKPVTYAAAQQDDPKPFLKQVLPSSLNRHVQCMHPVARPANPDAKKNGAKPFEGTAVRCDDVERAAASVRDILRSVGHLPRLPVPRGVKGPFELSTVHLARSRGGLVPMLLRMHTDGTTTGQLISTKGHPREDPMILKELPRALAAGRGRIPHRDRAALVDFLTQALALDTCTDRLFLIRAQTLRNKDVWPWLQNQHITPDSLLLPGVDCGVPTRGHPRTPAELPGLRIIRLNDDSDEIPLAFGVNQPYAPAASEETEEEPPSAEEAEEQNGDNPLSYEWGRYSGVVPWNEHTYLAINPRPDTHQLPKGVSKYIGPDANATRHGANPTSLEIHISFKQPTDNAADLASYVSGLRRCHLHTDTPTRLPLLNHLGRLMEEYID